MQKEQLSEKVNPYRMAEQGASLDGYFLIKDMGRLTPSLVNAEGQVDVQVVFGAIERQSTPFVKGSAKAHVTLQCQRCLSSFDYEIISDWLYGIIVSEEEEAALPKRYDPVFVDKQGMFLLRDMIEDELIINLPIVAMHDPKDCAAELPLPEEHLSQLETEKRENPFKVIEFLQSKPK